MYLKLDNENSWIRSYNDDFLNFVRYFLVKDMISQYQYAEYIAKLLNCSFRPYLSSFAKILLFLASVLAFGIVRIWHHHPGSNLMFPLCAFRCGFEALTLLGAAGSLNDKNKEVMDNFKNAAAMKKNKSGKVLRSWIRSCYGVRCTAGSLYTFENSIVVCCIHNAIQLTLNLLVTFQ
jgi:TM2 domain-containing membrane protein YozV